MTAEAYYGGPPSERQIAHFENAMLWLRDEGIIRFSTEERAMGEKFYVLHAVVTAYGFQLLSSKMEDGLLTGEAVKRVADGGSGYANIGSLGGGLLGGLIKALG